MLNPFPQLLWLTFFAPTLLRLAAAAIFAYVGYTHWSRRKELSRAPYPIIGASTWSIWVFLAFDAVVAILLAIGLYTQIAAILGMLGSVKFFVWYPRYPRAMVLERSASVLLFVICLSLLITGAGAYAFDIPL